MRLSVFESPLFETYFPQKRFFLLIMLSDTYLFSCANHEILSILKVYKKKQVWKLKTANENWSMWDKSQCENSFNMEILQKPLNSMKFLTKNLPKTVLFRGIVLIFSLEKLCFLENRVVRELCKQRTAFICYLLPVYALFFLLTSINNLQ